MKITIEIDGCCAPCPPKPDPHGPSRPTFLTVTQGADMSTVTLKWGIPALVAGQSALKSTKIYSRVAGAPDFGLVNEVPASDPTPDTLVLESVDPGDYEYQVTTVDVKDRESGPTGTTVNVPGGGVPPDSVGPSPPTFLTATVS